MEVSDIPAHTAIGGSSEDFYARRSLALASLSVGRRDSHPRREWPNARPICRIVDGVTGYGLSVPPTIQRTRHHNERDAARRVLGVAATADRRVVEQHFRRLAQSLHPDRGGDIDAFRRLLRARELLVSSPLRTDGRAALTVVHKPPLWRAVPTALVRVVAAPVKVALGSYAASRPRRPRQRTEKP